jgi:uncharacterized membrane protein HdeD (DUF308 family)
MATIGDVIPAVREDVRRTANWSIALGVLMVLGGIAAIAIPAIAGLAVTATFGWLLIIVGALHLGYAWQGHGAAAIIGEIAIAVLFGALGVYLLGRPVAGLASLTLALAGFLVLKAAIEAVIAFKLRPLPGTGWLVVDALLTAGIAVMIAVAWPASTAWAIGTLAGVAMISSGVTRVMLSSAVRRVVA